MKRYLAKPMFTLPDVTVLLLATALLEKGHDWAALGAVVVGSVVCLYLDRHSS